MIRKSVTRFSEEITPKSQKPKLRFQNSERVEAHGDVQPFLCMHERAQGRQEIIEKRAPAGLDLDGDGHAGVIYLMGRNGRYLGFMPPQSVPGRLIEILRKHLAQG